MIFFGGMEVMKGYCYGDGVCTGLNFSLMRQRDNSYQSKRKFIKG